MPQGEEDDSRGGEPYNVSRLRSSSIEIREKGAEFLREQLDAAHKVRGCLLLLLSVLSVTSECTLYIVVSFP